MTEASTRYTNQTIIALKFAIGNRVKIGSTDFIGTVYACNICKDGIEYNAKWFNDDGSRFSDWFHESELKRHD
jgi:flavodoxin